MASKAEQKSFQKADETRAFPNGTMDLLQIGGAEIGRLTLQPGWRWSTGGSAIAARIATIADTAVREALAP